MSRNKWIVVALAGLGAVCLLWFKPWANPVGSEARAAEGKALPLVAMALARSVDLPVESAAQGNVVPLNVVEIRPQLEGVVRSLHFREGDQVEAGQLLVSLDDRGTSAQLESASAQLAQVDAELADARRNYARAKELVVAKYISSSALDTAASKVEMLEAQRSGAIAAQQGKRVQSGYMRLYSPLAGKVGAISVKQGGLARPSDASPLVTIVQFDPVGVEFTVPEKEVAAIVAAQASGQLSVAVKNEDGSSRQGELVFVDNLVDPRTGTLKLKASFENADGHLWPGAFARIDLAAGVSRGAIVLPPQAVIDGADGHFVFQIDAQSKVRAKPVTLLRIQNGQAVVEGLESGERIIIEGNRDIRNGMSVKMQNPTSVADSNPGTRR